MVCHRVYMLNDILIFHLFQYYSHIPHTAEVLTLILLMWRIGWAPKNASRWQMGFNSLFKRDKIQDISLLLFCSLFFGRWAKFNTQVLFYIPQHAMLLLLCTNFEVFYSVTYKTIGERIIFFRVSSILIRKFRKLCWLNESFVIFLCQLRNATHRLTLTVKTLN